MKRTHIYIIVLALLLIIAGITFIVNYQEQKARESNEFAVKNVTDITKIALKNKDGKTMLLTKDTEGWVLNQKYRAKEQYVNEMLDAITNIYTFAPLADVAQENAIKQMSIKSTKVEVYTKSQNSPVKVFYVGGVSPGKKGTNMLLEINGKVAKKVCEVRLPGFEGFITDRFYIDEDLWRETIIFDLMPAHIKEIEVNYFQDKTTDSYLLSQKNGVFELKTLSKSYPNEKLNQEFVVAYLLNFSKKSLETFANDYTNKDSVIQNMPFADLRIVDIHDNEIKISTFYKPSDPKSKQQFDEEGEKVPYDVDRLFALVNDGKDFAIIQYYTFGNLFMEPEKFLKK
jgi:hypothetical protein